MAPIRKLNDNPDAIRTERYADLRKVRRKDFQDSGGNQRQFKELVDEFNTEGQAKENSLDRDSAEIRKRDVKGNQAEKLEILKNKASYRVNKSNDTEDIGKKVDIEA